MCRSSQDFKLYATYYEVHSIGDGSFSIVGRCGQLTSSFGTLFPTVSSTATPQRYRSTLISVKPNHTIWMSFDPVMKDQIKVLIERGKSLGYSLPVRFEAYSFHSNHLNAVKAQ